MPPNTPAQFPNFDLPGAEYFGLAPNAQIAIQGRRQKSAVSASAAIPPSSNWPFFGSVQLETNFLPTSGIYVHRVWLGVYSSGVIWANVTQGIMSLNIDPNQTPGEIPYAIGTLYAVPELSTDPTVGGTGLPAGTVSGQVILNERDFLVTYPDIRAFAQYTGNVLNLTFIVWLFNNDTTTGSNGQIQLFARIIYTRLDGLTV